MKKIKINNKLLLRKNREVKMLKSGLEIIFIGSFILYWFIESINNDFYSEFLEKSNDIYINKEQSEDSWSLENVVIEKNLLAEINNKAELIVIDKIQSIKKTNLEGFNRNDDEVLIKTSNVKENNNNNLNIKEESESDSDSDDSEDAVTTGRLNLGQYTQEQQEEILKHIKTESLEEQLSRTINHEDDSEETISLNNMAIQQLSDILSDNIIENDSGSNEEVEIDDIYMEMIKDGAMTIEDYLLYQRMWMIEGDAYCHYIEVQKKITELMCAGISSENMINPLVVRIEELGYTNAFANTILVGVLETRVTHIEKFISLMNTFTAKDLDLKVNNFYVDMNEMDKIVERCIKGIIDRQEMLLKLQIYLIKTGYSLNYIVYALEVINCDIDDYLENKFEMGENNE